MPRGLRGRIDGCDQGWLTGWAIDASGRPVDLSIFVDEVLLACVRADLPRPDVVAAGQGRLLCGFRVQVPTQASRGRPCAISVVANATRQLVGGQPLMLRQPSAGAPCAEETIAALCRQVAEEAEQSLSVERLGEQLVQVLGCVQVLFDRAKALNAVAALNYAKVQRVVEDTGGLAGSMGHFWGLVQQRYPQVLVRNDPSPRVSIVIPAHNQFALTYRCIESIATAGDRTPLEVILVDDASTDETLLAPVVFGGTVTVRRLPANAGYLRATNQGAAAASGEYVLLLNNDTLVEPGWLDTLVDTLDDHPSIAIAGSMLLFPDGRIQDCGGVIWRDGSGWNVGRGEDRAHPAYRHRRDCDYVSGAALMIRNAVWRALGGYDPHFAPAYYEDTDLCFRARAAGHRVVVQPASRVIHLEGQSHGTDLGSGVKRHQAINQGRFRERWAHTLGAHALPGGDLAVERLRHGAKNALFIDDTIPTPDQDAGSQAAVDHMLSLQRLGWEVSFLPADNLAFCPRYTPMLEARGIACWHRPFTQGVEEFLRTRQGQFDLIYVHRRRNLAHYGRMIRTHQPQARLIFSFADVHALRELRQAEIGREPAQRLRALRQQIDEEIDLAAEADAAIVHSPVERDMILARAPHAAVHVVPWSFAPLPGVSPAGRRGVVFIGGFRHAPNRDAAHWLVEEIWPLLRPGADAGTLSLIGSHPGADVQALARPGVLVTGPVTDLAPVLAQCRVTIAPLRFGAGIKGKVLTSLAAGVPCVMSPMAAEGLALPPPLAGLVADSPQALAGKLEHMMADDEAWLAASEAGLAHIRAHYSRARVDQLLAEALSPPCPPPVATLSRSPIRTRRLRA